jgi:hypothetical protein
LFAEFGMASPWIHSDPKILLTNMTLSTVVDVYDEKYWNILGRFSGAAQGERFFWNIFR